MKVAPLRRRGVNGKGCLVCALAPEQRQALNAAIWDGTEQRTRDYRSAAARVYEASTGRSIDLKSITRHTEHTEATWHEATEQVPARGNEEPVFATDYASLVERAAHLGSAAMTRLEGRISAGDVGDRELVTVAQLGVRARAQQEATIAASKRPQINVAAIFGIAGGHLALMPESEAIDVTPEEALYDEIEQERVTLRALAAGLPGPGSDAS